METCEYERICKDLRIEINGYEKNNWKPLMRQCLITSGICCIYLMQGLILGAPTVLVAQIRGDKNSTEVITDEMLSWLTSTPMISSILFVIILPWLLNRVGRKRTIIFVWTTEAISFIIFYTSTNLHLILISEVCAGVTFAAINTIFPLVVTEYTSTKYRGIFLNLKGASAMWGMWISNAIGTYFYWKNIAIAGFVCSVYIISVIVWPESPYWLAKNGRYTEAARIHRLLKGVNENSEKELAQLIITQKNLNSATLASEIEDSSVSKLSKMLSIIKSRSFNRPVFLSLMLLAQFYFTGKLIISMYAIEVLKHLSPDQAFVYKTMLILEGVTVASVYIGCIISRYCNRRTLLLLFTGTGILLLYILSLYLHLASLSVIIENDIVILLLLTIFSIAISCGPLVMCTTIYGEIIPHRYQKIAMTVVGLGGVTMMSILLKVSPFMFKSFKMKGSFLFYALTSSIILAILYMYLPETKNKTIREIEQSFDKDQVLPNQTEIELRENRDEFKKFMS